MFRAWRLGPFALTLLLAHSGCSSRSPHLTWVQGGIERGPQDKKQIALEFTGGGFAEGGDHILDVLKQHGIKASFFFTGDFFRTEEFAPVIRRVVNEGHYLGIHSDRHLLYCPWEDRNITLVEKDDFVKDLRDCQKEIVRFGADPAKNIYWIPPYE
ncbi:MAG TPA: polysaccharide deacetylase family protein, partial [Candidatus Sumerlaeota bacterium]|nr:polysaccharide deacetylase family protein [Candidatus Sumerlaeota bacterium]